MDYKEKVIALLNSQELSKEQKEKLEDIFPELAESDDERIRKAMIDFFKHEREEGITVLHYGVNIECMIAWLEKQGEHANFLSKIQVGDKVTRNEGGVLINLSQLKRVAKKDEKQGKNKDILEDATLDSNENGLIAETLRYKKEKQGEQKPTEDVNLPEFESYLCLMLQKFRTKGMCTNGEIIDYVKEHSQKLRDILVKPAWSEEDIEMIGNIRRIIEQYAFSQSAVDVNGELCEKEYIEADNWLKSLKDRVQPKQEWSEEDEMFVHGLIRGLVAKRDIHGHTTFSSDCIDITETINWLKSLKPQNTWKPSDEQMEALEHFIVYHNGSTNYAKDLEKLRLQLKKLREE